VTEEISNNLIELIKSFPTSSGVYLMKNDKGEVVYIGKAANLKSRVRSYFAGREERYQIKFLMRQVADIEVMVTDNEKEALILEDILIKKHRPRYNINLKDDKTYLSLKIDMNHDFPRLEVVRKRKTGKALYFGPFSSAQALRETLSLIQKIFLLRTCRETTFRNRTRPCLSYQIKRCLGPCCGLADKDEYSTMMNEVILFLKGKNREVIKRFTERMKQASNRLDFEEAALFRDRISYMEKTLEKQRVHASDKGDRDVLGLYREKDRVAAYLVFIRGGKITGGRSFLFLKQELPDREIVSSFLRRYYGGGRYLPSEIIIPEEIDGQNVTEEWLGELGGRRVYIKTPKRGEKAKLVKLAAKNATNSFGSKSDSEKEMVGTLLKIKELFALKKYPKKIECFDISNIQGNLAVGSMVVFLNGEAEKDLYRRFRIKSVQGADDYSMMYELLERRLKRGIIDQDLPDLILVDGGKGHLSVALSVARELELQDKIDILSIAKERLLQGRKKGAEKKEERVYIPGRKNSVKLKRERSTLFLFQRLRDEAHRFAITYHRSLRSREKLASPLDAIEGIGPARKRLLLNKFGSLKGIKGASVDELTRVRGISLKLAEAIKKSLAGFME